MSLPHPTSVSTDHGLRTRLAVGSALNGGTPEESARTATLLAPEGNYLLRLLTHDEYATLEPGLERVTLTAGQVVANPNEPFSHVYFPETCVFSQVKHLTGGDSVEVGTVGREGLCGISVFLGGDVLPDRVISQVPGQAQRMGAQEFSAVAESLPGLRHLLLRYTHAYLAQVAQTAACNAAHSVEQRCARWLLMTHDRVGGKQFQLTQEFLSFMLAVRRPGVTVAAGVLQRRGLLRYSRGKIDVLDRAGLEAASCECYSDVRSHFDRLLGPGSSGS